MEPDPIVDEVHQVRRRLLAECSGDLTKYIQRMESLGAKQSHLYVTKEQLAAMKEKAEPAKRPQGAQERRSG